MRPRALTPTSPLHTLIAAVPDKALRPLVLELMRNGAAETAPAAVDPPRRATKRRRGWPKGKPRGRRGRPRKAKAAATERKLLARRKRAVLYQRARRAAAKRALAGGGRGPNPPSPGLDGNGTKGPGAKPEITPAQLWAHAEAMQPLAPWRAVARELDLNTAQMQSCYRHRSLPPNLSSGAVEKFCALELPA